MAVPVWPLRSPTVVAWMTSALEVTPRLRPYVFSYSPPTVLRGDTLTVVRDDKTQVKIRLYAIDAPERGQPFGEGAKQFTSVEALGRLVHVEPRGRDRDKRWRT